MIVNPILEGFNPDPSILRVGDTYYIATSTFEWFPAIPLYRSKDLKNWQLFSHGLNRESQLDLRGHDPATGVWAPSLSYDGEKYYITYSNVKGFNSNNFDIDNYVISTRDIEGEWSEPVYLNSSGFDPSLFHDTDGKSYLVSLRWEFRTNYTHPGDIILQQYDKEKNVLIGDVKTISNGATERGCAEGPNIYKKDNFYYLVIAEGGTGYGHCVTVSRSKNIWGDYVGYENNPVVTSQPDDFSERGDPNSAKEWQYKGNAVGNYLQKAGHGSIVETQTGEVYISHLCSRPMLPQLRSTLGRESALQRCEFTSDGWIRMADGTNVAKKEVLEPNLPPFIFETTKEMEMLKYYTPRDGFSDSWCKHLGETTFSLRGRNSLFSRYDQSLVAKKVATFNYEFETKMTFKPENIHHSAGIVNYYNSNNFYNLRLYFSESLNGVTIGIMSADKGKRTEHRDVRVKIDENITTVYLKAVVNNENLKYYYALDDKKEWIEIGKPLDITILSDEYCGGFTGSMVGISATDQENKTTWAEFSYFKLTDL